ncbi:FAD:protein FMN transferase [Microbacterium hominis]|uniref:FAD:protein FMN transferase n=1 Tax=Microbacterium hominis TaxID=162426 RepID=A0A7D4TG30_9MICO|nr:FAD:protein FMN transferase [Microbacterium hominis]QKJ19021.1 FAD:protein FMN transferase [Microbacterium hominis]
MTAPAAVWRFDAIGTAWEVETSPALDARARARVTALIERFDAAWSRFRGDSTVRRLAEAGGTAPEPPDAAAMLEAFGALSTATAGAVSPLVGGALEARGYDPDYALVDRGPVPAPRDWRSLLHWGGGLLRLDAPAVIDVGALGKGRLVDLVLAEVIGAIGAHPAVIDAGGDIAVRGIPQRIGLEHPYDTRRAIGVWEVRDAALCASAVNRRAWGDGLHHVLDARTGEPVRAVAATWAVADTAMRADAIATALFFDGGEALAHEWGVSWVRMLTDGRVEWSPGCTADLFTGR